jgi:hypothetical protein
MNNPNPVMNPESLTERAMLVSITIKVPSNSKQDKDSTSEVTASHHAADGAARVNKTLMPKDVVQTFTKPASAARQAVYDATLPWGQQGIRILLAANYFKLMKAVEVQEKVFWAAVEKFKERLDDHIASARQQLGTLFREDDYPTREELESAFSFELKFMPLTDASDWRVKLGADEEARIQQRIQDRMERSIAEAAKEPWRRVKEAAAALAERLETRAKQELDPNHKGRATPLKSSLLDNLSELASSIEGLNITNDPNLSAIGKEIEKALMGQEMSNLKGSPEAQNKLAGDMRSLEERVNEYAGLI